MPGTTAWSAGAPLTESKFIEVVGSVQVVGAGGAVRNAKAGDVFKAPDSIQTGANSRAELVAEDKTVTRVGANTAFSFAGSGREVNLKKGSLLFHSPTGKGGGTVKSEGATAAVLGTTLAVSATQAGGFKVMTLEGKASVQQPGGAKVSLGAGQMTFATPGQALSQPLNFSISGTAGGSKLVNGFSQPLASMPKIEVAITRQQAELEKGGLVATGLFIGDSADKAFKVDSSVIATYVQGASTDYTQGKQDESQRTDDKFDLAYMKAATSALSIIDQIAAPSTSIFLLDGKGKSESGLLLPRSVGALAGKIADGQITQLSLGDSVVIAPTDGLLSVLPSSPVDHVVIASVGSMQIGVDNLVIWPKDDSIEGDNRRPVHFVAGSTLLFGSPQSGGGDSTTPRSPMRLTADLPEVGFYQIGSGLDVGTLSAKTGSSASALNISSVIISNLYDSQFSTAFLCREKSNVLVPSVLGSPEGSSVSGEVVSDVPNLIPLGTTIQVQTDGVYRLSNQPTFSSDLKSRINRVDSQYGLVSGEVYSAEVFLTIGGNRQRYRVTEGSTEVVPVGTASGYQEGWRISVSGSGLESATITKVLPDGELVGGRVLVDGQASSSGSQVAQVSGSGGVMISAPSIELSAVGLVSSGWVAITASGDVSVKGSRVSDPVGEGQFGLVAFGDSHPSSVDGTLSVQSTRGSILIDTADLTGDSVSLNAFKSLTLGQMTSESESAVDVDDELSMLVSVSANMQGKSAKSVANLIGETINIYGVGFLSFDSVNITAQGESSGSDIIKIDKSVIRADEVKIDGRKGNVQIGGPIPVQTTMVSVPVDQLVQRVKVVWNKEEYNSRFTATAGNELSVSRTFFDVGEVNLSANTVVVADTKFREGSRVNFASKEGKLAPNPNTNQPKVLGHVNLIRNVYYGENLIRADMVSHEGDAVPKNIHVKRR